MINYFDKIPNEVVVEILSKLDVPSIKEVSQVCRRFRNVSDNFHDKMAKRKFDRIVVRPFCQSRDSAPMIDRADFMISLFTPPIVPWHHDSSPYCTKIYIVTSNVDKVYFAKMRNNSFDSNNYLVDACRVKALVKDPIVGLFEVMSIVLKKSRVKELLFAEMTITHVFIQCMLKELDLRRCSFEWLCLDIVKLNIDVNCFGSFISHIGSPNIELGFVTVLRSLLNNDEGSSYLLNALKANPHLSGISLTNYYDHGDDIYSILYGKTFDYGEIFPTHIFRNIRTSVDSLIFALKEWRAGRRKLERIRTLLDRPAFNEDFHVSLGIQELFGKSPRHNSHYSVIDNQKGEQLCLETDKYGDYFSIRPINN